MRFKSVRKNVADQNQSHVSDHPLSHNHLHQLDADMDIRGPFSRLKKKVKHLGNKHKPGRTRPDVDGEIVDPANSSPRPAPHVTMGDGEGDGQQACLTDQPSQPDEPEPVPLGESENNQGGEGGVDGREGGQRYAHLHSDVGVMMRTGPSRGRDDVHEDGEQFYFRSSSPSTSHSGKPDGM